MKNGRILIVEDDRNISKLIKYNLEKCGFDCSVSFTGEEALEALQKEIFSLVMLDIMLPEMNGFEVCKYIKQEKRLSQIPVLMLTAKGEEVDRIVGLELGADDYVVKPFSPRELVLRVKAILKREILEEPASDVLSIDKVVIDIARHKVNVDKKEIELTLLEFKLLLTLAQRRGRVQSRERLLSDVWDMASDVTTRTIDTHIKRLRQKLGKSGRLIETVRGIGYRLSEKD